MATSKSERALGDRWAKLKRLDGWWIQKLPSSALAGLPDWLVVTPDLGGVALIEAKKLRQYGDAFRASQCTAAQRFFLEVVARHGGYAGILILGDEGWLLVRVNEKGVVDVPLAFFQRHALSYSEY